MTGLQLIDDYSWLPAKPWFSPKEVAEILGVAHSTVTKYLERGQIRGEKNGHRWEIARTELIRRSEGISIEDWDRLRGLTPATPATPTPPVSPLRSVK